MPEYILNGFFACSYFLVSVFAVKKFAGGYEDTIFVELVTKPKTLVDEAIAVLGAILAPIIVSFVLIIVFALGAYILT